MHSTSTQLGAGSAVEQSYYWPNWGSQLCKSVILTASSVGLGWVVSRLWRGTDGEGRDLAQNSHQLTVYNKGQKNYHSPNVESFHTCVVSAEVCELVSNSKTLFQKIEITYKSSVQEAENSPEWTHSLDLDEEMPRHLITEIARNPAQNAENSNFHMLSVCYFIANFLAQGNVQRLPLAPFVFSVIALSMPKNVKALDSDDVPIGSVIAYASDKLPAGYLKCNGAMQSKTAYPELYEVLKGYCDEDFDNFKVPNYQGLFLRGAEDGKEIGKFFEDTTRMPKELKIGAGGMHVHTTSPSGEHSHIADLAGKHSHTLDAAGKHSHQLSEDGNHKHRINDAGEHQHDTQTSQSRPDQTGGYQGSSRTLYPIPAEGRRRQDMMFEAGIHNHEMESKGSHRHEISSAPDHEHRVSSEAPHLHVINPNGLHTHTIPESGLHTHEVVGGDEETRPKNRKVAYLIKAKPNRQIKELQEQVQELKKALDEKFQDGFRTCN